MRVHAVFDAFAYIFDLARTEDQSVIRIALDRIEGVVAGRR